MKTVDAAIRHVTATRWHQVKVVLDILLVVVIPADVVM
jgi:hypothetical protein